MVVKGEDAKKAEKKKGSESSEGIPVRVARDGHLVERQPGQRYSGEATQEIYVDSQGRVYAEPGEGRKKIRPVPAYITDDGMLHADTGRYQVMFGEDKDGNIHYIARPYRAGGVEGRVAAAIALTGMILGLFALTPMVTGNVISEQGISSGTWFGGAFMLIGILAAAWYFIRK